MPEKPSDIIQPVVFEPIEVGLVGAGLAITTCIEADVGADKTTGDWCAEESAVYFGGNAFPFPWLRSGIKSVSLSPGFNLEIELPGWE